jgi:RNA polymerase sigma factor (sigma-70 family)
MPKRTAPAQMRQVLVMRYFHDMTLKQIGDVLGMTQEGVRKVEERAFRIIRSNPQLRQRSLDVLSELDQR